MRYYCGFEFAAVDGWEAYMPGVKSPSNYKDATKIAAYVEKRVRELAEEAALLPLTGRVTRAVVVARSDGEAIDVVFDESGNFVGTQFLEFIFHDSGLKEDPAKLSELLVIGHNVFPALRVMAIDYIITTNGSLPPGLHWAVGLDTNLRCGFTSTVESVLDPVSVLGRSKEPELLAKRFGLPLDSREADKMAVLACQLASRLGL